MITSIDTGNKNKEKEGKYMIMTVLVYYSCGYFSLFFFPVFSNTFVIIIKRLLLPDIME